MFLARKLLLSVRMLPEPAIPVENSTGPTLAGAVWQAIEGLYQESGAKGYGITPERFHEIVGAVAIRYCADASEAEQLELVAGLRVEELVLARACSTGNEAAWKQFIVRFRAPLFATACRITKDEAAGRELTDGLNAELYGIPNSDGRRISKLDYYMGRGSLEGWLRTVLARQHIDQCRAHAKEISLEEQIEDGVSFPDRPQAVETVTDNRVPVAIAKTLAELDCEERFMLASYYLDRRTLADIGRMTGLHESTISRKLDKLTGALRKRVRRRLQEAGMESRRCNEILEEIDVRDIEVDVRGNLRQERPVGSF
jgi:RNA polymerase sigma-70 factor (ECF subfamily)